MSAVVLLPRWLVHIAVVAVWFYEGLWCKLLNGEPNQVRIAEQMPRWGPHIASGLLKSLGVVEVTVGLWVLTRIAPFLCAAVQSILLIVLNSCGLLWARRLIHDPGGMIVKNFAFLVLVWVSASSPGWN